MTRLEEVREVVSEALQLGSRSSAMSATTALIGAIPEFDSIAVVSLLTALEDRYGFTVEDDEITAETFETLGSLTDFVESKL